jgi:isochorismate synthase
VPARSIRAPLDRSAAWRAGPAAPVELTSDVDLLDVAASARAAGHEVAVVERALPRAAASFVGVGSVFTIVATQSEVVLQDWDGNKVAVGSPATPLVAAQRLWNDLAPRLRRQSHGPPLSPVALGGFGFDLKRDPAGAWQGTPTVRFRVPRLTVGRIEGRTVAWGDRSLLPTGVASDARTKRRLIGLYGAPAGQWCTAVDAALTRLRSGEADKVVLARELAVASCTSLSAIGLARALRRAYPTCYTFLFCGGASRAFVGASPELLIAKHGIRAVSRPMAGSIARGRDTAEDRALGERLRTSVKDGEEHRLTAAHVHSRLMAVSRQVVTSEPEMVLLTNVRHLATTIEAELADRTVGVLELAATLHPTPAVCGAPTAAAATLISQLERFERGWYGGGVGWIGSDGDGEIAVAIRCGLVGAHTARLYAGAGVMPGSDPAAEWHETELKLQALLTALEDH